MPEFQIVSDYTPGGDQPAAIDQLEAGVRSGQRFQTLLGATGTGKTFTMAHLIARLQRPTLVIAHNKTLASQLCSEFRSFFPHNRVEYFVSYYDYYQPEAYIPSTDTYIEKDSSVNKEIERLRHSSTQAVLERNDVIVVASVSCIYGLGSPDEYREVSLQLQRGASYRRDEILTRLIEMQFERNQMELQRGTFRVRGDIIEIMPADEEKVIRAELFGDELEKITVVNMLTGEIMSVHDSINVYAATHFVTSQERLAQALETIRIEADERLAWFRDRGMLLEAQRLEQRTNNDLEMIRSTGFCSGIENYSRILDGRDAGTHPNTLFDYFPEGFLTVIDESHQTLPQLRAMYNGDRARKQVLIDFGFRLPSAADNRPLKFHEWEAAVGQAVFVSATPGPYEREHSGQLVEQIIRPTGLMDPEVIIRPTRGQIDDLIGEIRQRVESGQRTLVTTLTKRMAEDLTAYLQDAKMRVSYLHSDIKTLDRMGILRDLRLGAVDVVVGINLLREGLDLPEVSLVAILDADKEGFLRSDTSLVQTIGRAARHVSGQVIMYADTVTGSMQRAIDETNRRRQKQSAYNEEHGITPQSVQKEVRELLQASYVSEDRPGWNPDESVARLHTDAATIPASEISSEIAKLELEMREAAKSLNFEYAAELRDEIKELRRLAPAAAAAAGKGGRGAPAPPRPRRGS
ncbi:MAG: excinuclease ABC subunit UvrB [Armatimonadetes bacterium]|nr:excinuclease ABC subunit UvrB [Armatimonadota bacterium]MDE2206767.1 excinuclease ABC subunit UvrB [Armatimonadota bacterium]